MSEFPTLNYLEQEFARLERAEGTEGIRRSRLPRSRRWLVAAVVGIVSAVILIATPAGAAIVDWIADLVGIGDSPSRSETTGETAIVFGVGTSPAGDRFEVVASRETPGGIGAPATCFSIDASPSPVGPTPGAPLSVASCLTLDALDGVAAHGITAEAEAAPEALAQPGTVLVQGLVTEAAANVTGSLAAAAKPGAPVRDLNVTFARLEPDLAAAIGAREHLGYYVAFLPRDALDATPDQPEIEDLVSRIEMRALAQDGSVLGKTRPEPSSVVAISVGLPGPATGARPSPDGGDATAPER